MNDFGAIPFIVTIWLIVCAVIDTKQGEVSNWLTIPGMAAGVIYAIDLGGDRLILVVAVFIGLMLLFMMGSMGGADVKVLIGISGLWPTALILAFIFQGVWGIIVLIKKGRGYEFRAIPAYAIGALIGVVLFI